MPLPAGDFESAVRPENTTYSSGVDGNRQQYAATDGNGRHTLRRTPLCLRLGGGNVRLG